MHVLRVTWNNIWSSCGIVVRPGPKYLLLIVIIAEDIDVTQVAKRAGSMVWNHLAGSYFNSHFIISWPPNKFFLFFAVVKT